MENATVTGVPPPAPPMVTCPHCRTVVAAGTLVCPNCGGLVYQQALDAIARDAMALEPHDPARAAFVWRHALDLLPPGSGPHAAVGQRAAGLSAGLRVDPIAAPQPPAPLPDTWQRSAAKTLGSMLLSILVYAMIPGFGGVRFAAGFTLLILIHEMGHVLAMRYYGLDASPPVFIPFVGALINLRQSPPNAKVEAIVGIAGPIAGTLASAACLALWWYVPALHASAGLLWRLACIGLFMNLFNLLPVPPLDGGRVTAAVSPWIWLLGLAGLIYMIVADLLAGSYTGVGVMGLVLFYAMPRLRATLRARGRDNPYYRIGRAASWTIGALYVALGASLAVMLILAGGMAALR